MVMSVGIETGCYLCGGLAAKMGYFMVMPMASSVANIPIPSISHILSNGHQRFGAQSSFLLLIPVFWQNFSRLSVCIHTFPTADNRGDIQ